MSRRLAGIFDLARRAETAGLRDELGGESATILALPPICVSFTGSSPKPEGTLCLLDGFIDNSAELAGALGVRGVGEPEELLALGFRTWGRDLIHRLRGDFVLLLWDPVHAKGLLARDQLGLRSLFLHEHEGVLRFATEIRDLLPLLVRRPTPDPAGVAHWITMTARPGDGTLYTGVRRLGPGRMLLLDRDGAREQRYWQPRFRDPLEAPASELPELIRNALDLAVARRLDTERPTGVLMSGGLDSSAVAAVAAAQAPGRVMAYSAEFPDHPGVDESREITELRHALALGGTAAKVAAGGLLASALGWITAWEVPPTTWGEFWAGPLMRAAAAEGPRIILSGEGGDELFGCRSYLMADRLRTLRFWDVLSLARRLPGAGADPPLTSVMVAAAEFGIRGAVPYRLHNALRRAAAKRRLPLWVHAPLAREVAERDDRLAWKRLDGPRWWSFDTHVLTRGVEQFGVFENHRRQGALAGVHCRHPLFDLDLFELCLRLPPLESFDAHMSRPLLRASVEGLLPDRVRLRPSKALFDSLLIDSLDGPDRMAMGKLFAARRPELGAYIDIDAMRRDLLDRGPDRTVDRFQWMFQMWRLVTAECWLRVQAGTEASVLADELRVVPARVSLHSRARTDHRMAAGTGSRAVN